VIRAFGTSDNGLPPVPEQPVGSPNAGLRHIPSLTPQTYRATVPQSRSGRAILTNLTIKLADTESDFDAARHLCREWLKVHWEIYPDDWPKGDDHPMGSKRFGAFIEDLPNLHARPKGGILVAYLNDQPAGCVMYADAGDGSARFNRLFVSTSARGNAIGRNLLERMFEQMKSDGYKRVFFSSATFLPHVRKMYENIGFTPMPTPDDVPEIWRDRIYFMERALN